MRRMRSPRRSCRTASVPRSPEHTNARLPRAATWADGTMGRSRYQCNAYRRKSTCMTNWRRWAKHGLWSFVEIDPHDDPEEQELGELREVLEAVVPMIPSDFADQGLLAPPRRARQSDVAFIRKHVDEGNYELDMCGIRNKYSGFPRPPEIAQRLTCAAVRRRGDFELMVYELRYAALMRGIGARSMSMKKAAACPRLAQRSPAAPFSRRQPR